VAPPHRTGHRDHAAPATRPPPSAAGPPDPFDRWAATYDTSLLQCLLYQPVHQAVLRHAHRHACDPARILDIGCGTGRLLHAAAHTYSHAAMIGTDPSPSMIRNAAAGPTGGTTARIRFVRARAEALPFGDATFDLVLSTLSLRHWHDRWRGLAEIGRVIAGSGVVILADVLQPRRRSDPGRWLPWASSLPAGVHRAITTAGLSPDHVETVPLTIPMTTTTLIVARPAPSALPRS